MQKPNRCEGVVFITVVSRPGLLLIESHRHLTVITYDQKPLCVTFLQQLLHRKLMLLE